MPQSPTNKDSRYFTESCKMFTTYATITDKKYVGELPWEIQTELVRWYISSGNLFVLARFFLLYNRRCFFFLPTEIATEMRITNDQYSDRRFSSVTLSVKFLPTECVSYTDRNIPSVKMLNVIVV
jgi:hypothetical protein